MTWSSVAVGSVYTARREKQGRKRREETRGGEKEREYRFLNASLPRSHLLFAAVYGQRERAAKFSFPYHSSLPSFPFPLWFNDPCREYKTLSFRSQTLSLSLSISFPL